MYPASTAADAGINDCIRDIVSIYYTTANDNIEDRIPLDKGYRTANRIFKDGG
jgi:hypothetical protein